MILAPDVSTPARNFDAALAEARAHLAAYQQNPADAQTLENVGRSRREIAQLVAALPSSKREGPEVAAVEIFLAQLWQSGVMDQGAMPEDVALLAKTSPKQWSGLLACMNLIPAWEWSDAPRYDAVPAALWAIFTRYCFYVPQAFALPGQAERYAEHYLRRLTELEHWVSANKGSSAVKAAVTAFANVSNCIPLYFTESSLKKHYELRGKILAFAFGVSRQVDLAPFSREGRRLRVGFINRHFGPQTETYTTVPTFECLDPERFEVVLFAHRESGSALEEHAKSRASEFHLLQGSMTEQVQSLLASNLDIAVFGTNVTAVPNEVFTLALHRVAPLQVVNNSSCTTTGLPEIDLYVSGSLTEMVGAQAHFSERLGLLPGPAHAFNYAVDLQEPTQTWTREALGVPADCTLFVTAANFYKVIPEVQHAWARILSEVPESRLLIHPFNPNWSSEYPIKRFCAEFDRVLKEYGVGEGRLIVSTAKFPSRTDVKELLRVGDLYLDSHPFAGVNSLIDPLECGIPVITQEGSTFRSRMGAAILRSLGLEECIARNTADYHQLAVKYGSDKEARKGISDRIVYAMERQPQFLDSLAASDAFGGLLETAFDELNTVGRAEFRKAKEPLRAALGTSLEESLSEVETSLSIGMPAVAWDNVRRLLSVHPNNPIVRRAAGKVLLALGNAGRASTYLLEAVQHTEGDAGLWCELAVALLENNQPKQAVEALQACLTIDGQHLDGILLLAKVAEGTQQHELLAETFKAASTVAPEDPRVIELGAKVQILNPES